MRQFLFGYNVAAVNAETYDKLKDGQITFAYLDPTTGANTVDKTGTKMKGYGSIVLARSAENGGNIVLPFYNKNFSYSKMEYKAGTTFEATVTIPAATIVSDHTLIFTKKGIQFNERANWSATVYAKDDTSTPESIAKAIVKYVNDNRLTLGLIADYQATGKVHVKADKVGVDYAIAGADALFGVAVTYTTHGKPAIADVNMIKRFASEAAADAGFEYTYDDALYTLYPGYDFNPLAQPNKADTGFTVFTLRFAVPRAVKTRDEVVHQIVQIAFPTGNAQIAATETILKGIIG